MTNEEIKLANWDKDPENGRWLCTPEKPMPKGAKGLWSHTGITCIGSNYEGNIDYYVCVDCDAQWKVNYDY